MKKEVSPLLTVLAFSQNEESAPTLSIPKPGTPTTLFKPNAVACASQRGVSKDHGTFFHLNHLPDQQ